MDRMSATKLRADLYRVIESVITKGVPVEVDLRGRTVRIVPSEAPDKLARLVRREGVVSGNAADLPKAKAFDEKQWRRKWDRRLR
jgi:antitoxin (DNA-binding transcriptional repressor) of toxin-antitoxin stability system